ncbi:MAG: agmatinase family protein [Acidobacteria bacterium]|nr:agmatinase family protein [Acidobacteriota bacterium]
MESQVNQSILSHDPKWQRANTLFNEMGSSAEIALIGVPAFETCLSKSAANLTPGAIRAALSRFSTYSATHEIDLSELTFSDLGDIENPDHEAGEKRVAEFVRNIRENYKLLIALGGDNSITYSVAAGLWPDMSRIGLITLDAHHDLRDGISNGAPVWRLIQSGLPGKNIVQIGISDFANSKAYADRARENGVHVVYRDTLRKRPISDVMVEALEIAGCDGREIYVDLDVDVCDRSIAPACPASVPGGISADELRQVAYLAGSDYRVRAIDITEIDASLDTEDQRTVRLAALLVLEAAAGFAKRKN